MKANTIVVGFDGSDCARKALDACAQLIDDGGTVHIVTAYDTPSIRTIELAYAHVPNEFLDHVDLLAHERGFLDQAAAFFKQRKINYAEHFVDDHPASAMLDLAEALDADLIVVGSRGLGRGTRFVRGSVSTKIANNAKTSFLVIQE